MRVRCGEHASVRPTALLHAVPITPNATTVLDQSSLRLCKSKNKCAAPPQTTTCHRGYYRYSPKNTLRPDTTSPIGKRSFGILTRLSEERGPSRATRRVIARLLMRQPHRC